MDRKAQTALEYLMTYGWAILIIIIVGSALYALGVFSPGTFTGKRSTGFSQFQMADFKVDTDENVTLVMGNRLGKTITINEITATYKGDDCSDTFGNYALGPNKQHNFVLECNSDWGNLELKSSYSIEVGIGYTDPDSNLTHLDAGTLFGIIE